MGERFNFNKGFVNLILIAFGLVFLSVATNVFYAPNDVVVGGFTGIAIIVQRFTKGLMAGGIPISVTNLVLNIPLFIIAYFSLGKKYIGKTVITTILFSVALQMSEILPKYVGDLTLVVVFGGIIDGIGLGLILRAMASTGGVETLAMLIHMKMKHVGVAKIIFAVNAVIIGLGVFVFGFEKAMYAVISVFISSKVIDSVLEGLAFSKAAFIISEKSEIIAEEIMEVHGRGVTALKGKGMYTGEDKNVLFCVFSQKEITVIKDVVRKYDANAFLIVADIKEVMGEGFKSFNDF